MFKKIFFGTVILISLFLLTGCGVDKIVAVDPLSDEELISYVKENIYNETGDEVIVKITSKEQLYVCTVTFDGCQHYQNAEGGHSFSFEVLNPKNHDIIADGYYDDGYIMYDNKFKNGKSEEKIRYNCSYSDNKSFYLANKEIVNILDNSKINYYFHDSKIKYFYDNLIFLSSSNYYTVNDVLTKIDNVMLKYKNNSSLKNRIYIFKDDEVFDKMNFDLYTNQKEIHGYQSIEDTIKLFSRNNNVTFIDEFDKLDYNVFVNNGKSDSILKPENGTYDSFNYYVFVYESSKFKLYGVK